LPETVEPIVHCALECCPVDNLTILPQLQSLSSNFFSQLCQKLSAVHLIHSLTG
jgi:hypothetical protein